LARLADEWAENTSFYNICGPTEITILNTAHLHSPGVPLSIGKPLPNTTCYILDENEQPVPIGKKGTIWVGGAGVTQGYINLPELTSNRYKPDKFRKNGYVPLISYFRGNPLTYPGLRCLIQVTSDTGMKVEACRYLVVKTIK
jgi:non-ribosomal peptide synthetase component F